VKHFRSEGHRPGGRRRTLCSIAAAILVGMAGPAGAGTIKGLVTLEAPSAKHGSSELQPTLPAAVWIDGPSASALPKARPVLSQRNVQFSSPLLLVVVGQTVDMPNEDDVAHNVYSSSPAKLFNLGIYPKGGTRQVTFDQVGTVDVRCSIHRRMSARIVVVPNSYYALTAIGSRYQITNVPAGAYRLHAWAQGLPELEQWINVPQNGDLILGLSLARAQ
jgi:plastocyanin